MIIVDLNHVVFVVISMIIVDLNNIVFVVINMIIIVILIPITITCLFHLQSRM